MLTIALVWGGIVLASLLVMIWLRLRAPAGYQDADGFHLGKREDAQDGEPPPDEN